MQLFTPEQYSLLPEEIVARPDLPMLVDRATIALLDRYAQEGAVCLRGFDPAAMDPELLTRLRYAIADVVEHVVTAPDARIRSAVRGGRQVVFKEAVAAMPASAFRLLDPFDQRQPLWRI